MTALLAVCTWSAIVRGPSGRGDHQVVPHDRRWEARAQELTARLRAVLGEAALAIEHIGSTSVPGLASRPIPDIQVSVADIHDRDSFVPQLALAGYRRFRFPELDVDDYLVFVPADGSNTEHIQVCQRHSHQEHRHLAVRDYLRSNARERDAYERAKRSAAAAARGDRAQYSAGKDAFVEALERRALRWASGSRH